TDAPTVYPIESHPACATKCPGLVISRSAARNRLRLVSANTYMCSSTNVCMRLKNDSQAIPGDGEAATVGRGTVLAWARVAAEACLMRSCLSRRRAASNPGGGVWMEGDAATEATVRALLDFSPCAHNPVMKRSGGTLGKMPLPMRPPLPAARIMRSYSLATMYP